MLEITILVVEIVPVKKKEKEDIIEKLPPQLRDIYHKAYRYFVEVEGRSEQEAEFLALVFIRYLIENVCSRCPEFESCIGQMLKSNQ